MASDHGINDFHNILHVAEAHAFGEGFLKLYVWVSAGIDELFHKCVAIGEGSRTVPGDMRTCHTSLLMFGADLIDKCLARNLDLVL